MPQIMGSGAAFFDIDGDQDLDLLLISGAQQSLDRTSIADKPRLIGLFRRKRGQVRNPNEGVSLARSAEQRDRCCTLFAVRGGGSALRERLDQAALALAVAVGS